MQLKSRHTHSSGSLEVKGAEPQDSLDTETRLGVSAGFLHPVVVQLVGVVFLFFIFACGGRCVFSLFFLFST